MIGFAYVVILFSLATFGSCWCLFYYTNTKEEVGKQYVISRMERISKFQEAQQEQMFMVDSLYSMIRNYNPDLKANYVENDIEYYLKQLNVVYDQNKHDNRFKVFAQISSFYNMWFGDKKFIRMAGSFVNIDDVHIDLIDKINPFQKAFEILSKSVTTQVLKLIDEHIQSTKIEMTEEEAILLWPKIKEWVAKSNGEQPNIQAFDHKEKRMAEALVFLRELKRQKALGNG